MNAFAQIAVLTAALIHPIPTQVYTRAMLNFHSLKAALSLTRPAVRPPARVEEGVFLRAA
jgi:hypothetical protein